MQFGEDGTVTISENGHLTHTVSYDEKTVIQAIANKYSDHKGKRLWSPGLRVCAVWNAVFACGNRFADR